MITPAEEGGPNSSKRSVTKSAQRRSGRPVKAIWAFFIERCKRMLVDLANVSDDCTYFRHCWGVLFLRGESDDEILSLRDRLRTAWEGGTESVDLLSHKLASEVAVSGFGGVKWVEFTLHDRTVLRVPNFFNLRMALCMAIVELAPQMSICPNPDCPQRCFVKTRSTQKICDRRACIQFGQRQYKRDWWKEHGHQWRERQQAKKSRARKGAKR